MARYELLNPEEMRLASPINRAYKAIKANAPAQQPIPEEMPPGADVALGQEPEADITQTEEFQTGRALAEADPEVAVAAAQEVDSQLGEGASEAIATSKDPIEMQRKLMADREAKLAPYIEPQKQGLKRMEDLLKNYQNQTSGVSMKPLAALADAWSRSAAGSFRETDLAKSMADAPDPKQRALADLQGEASVQTARDQLLDSVIKAYGGGRELSDQNRDRRFETSRGTKLEDTIRNTINDKVFNQGKDTGLDMVMLDYQQMADNFNTNNQVGFATALGSYLRRVAMEKGTLSEGDQARVNSPTFTSTMNKIMAYAESNPGQKIPDSMIRPYLDIVERSKKNYVNTKKGMLNSYKKDYSTSSNYGPVARSEWGNQFFGDYENKLSSFDKINLAKPKQQSTKSKPETVIQNGVTYKLNKKTGQYE